MTSLSLSLSCIGEGNGNPLQCSCLENPREGGAWWAAVYGVAQSRTRLKRLSSSSIGFYIEAETPILWPPDAKNSMEKTLMLGQIIEGRRRGQQRMRWLDEPGGLQSMGLLRVGHD